MPDQARSTISSTLSSSCSFSSPPSASSAAFQDYQRMLDLIRDIILATDLAHHLRIFKDLQKMADGMLQRHGNISYEIPSISSSHCVVALD